MCLSSPRRWPHRYWSGPSSWTSEPTRSAAGSAAGSDLDSEALRRRRPAELVVDGVLARTREKVLGRARLGRSQAMILDRTQAGTLIQWMASQSQTCHGTSAVLWDRRREEARREALRWCEVRRRRRRVAGPRRPPRLRLRLRLRPARPPVSCAWTAGDSTSGSTSWSGPPAVFAELTRAASTSSTAAAPSADVVGAAPTHARTMSWRGSWVARVLENM